MSCCCFYWIGFDSSQKFGQGHHNLVMKTSSRSNVISLPISLNSLSSRDIAYEYADANAIGGKHTSGDRISDLTQYGYF